ncbi:hypothetical protein EDC04DRAFT_2607977 [Pisolithus marmoratus]|nr:hypothetical protein EDC04DRAFT_2607977 [Pisolithus marmoratus]
MSNSKDWDTPGKICAASELPAACICWSSRLTCDVGKSLGQLPVLGDRSFHDLLGFMKFSCMAKPAIEHHTVDICYPPENLPGSVERLLAGVLGAGLDVIQSYWVLLCHVVWHADVVVPSTNDIKEFNRLPQLSHGLSSMNCACIYDVALADPNAYILNNRLAFAIAQGTEDVGKSWPCSLQMRDEDVLNGLFIYSLLLDKAEKQSQLVLIHDSLQHTRIDAALIVRNKEMEGIGQEAYPHACDKCFAILNNEQGQKEHTKLEEAYYKPAKALFQLHAQLTRAGLSVQSDSVVTAEEAEDIDEESVECDGKSDKGSSNHLKARFGI